MSEHRYYARLAALDKALQLVEILDSGTFSPETVVKAAAAFLEFTGEPDPQPQPVILPAKTVAYVIVDGQSPSGARMYFNGYAGGMPAWASHIAQAIRFSREQDAAAMIDSFDGHVCHVEEREFDAWAG